MLEVFALRLTQTDFRGAPEDERVFYLKLGMIANEVSALNKLSLFSLRQPRDSELMNRAGSTLGMMTFRLLAGRLYEAHHIITTGFSPLKRIYNPIIGAGGADSYQAIKAYFARQPNPLKEVRRKLAFHTDDAIFRAGVEEMDEDEDIVDYHTIQQGNTLFWGSEAALLYAFRKATKTDDAVAMYRLLLSDTQRISANVSEFAYAFAVAFFQRHFPEQLDRLPEEKMEIVGAPVLTEVSLPWFCEPPLDH